MWRSLVVPLAAVAALCGCIYTPVKSPVYPSAVVGPAGSNAPLRVGVATRPDVIAHFGKPIYSTEHELAIGYLLSAKVGHVAGLLMGPCSTRYFGSVDQSASDNLWLEFDDRGVLKRFVRQKIDANRDQESWLLFCVRVPDKPRADQIYFPDEEKY